MTLLIQVLLSTEVSVQKAQWQQFYLSRSPTLEREHTHTPVNLGQSLRGKNSEMKPCQTRKYNSYDHFKLRCHLCRRFPSVCVLSELPAWSESVISNIFQNKMISCFLKYLVVTHKFITIAWFFAEVRFHLETLCGIKELSEETHTLSTHYLQ